MMKKLITTLAFALVLFTQVAKADFNTNLTVYFPFEVGDNNFVTNNTFNRGSASFKNLFVSMTTANYGPGVFGNAISFTNTSAQYIDFTTTPFSSGSKTISFWINVASTTNSGMYLLTSYDGAGNNEGIKIIRNAGGTISTGWASSNGSPITSAGSVGTSTWSLLTIVLSNSGTGAIWINGVKSVSASIGTESTATNRYRLCGRWATANSGSAVLCQVLIDDFRVYTRLLTDNEIKTLYAEGVSQRYGLGKFFGELSPSTF